MPDYKAMYYRMAGKMADAIELLIQAQREGEEAAMADDCTEFPLAPCQPENGE